MQKSCHQTFKVFERLARDYARVSTQGMSHCVRVYCSIAVVFVRVFFALMYRYGYDMIEYNVTCKLARRSLALFKCMLARAICEICTFTRRRLLQYDDNRAEHADLHLNEYSIDRSSDKVVKGTAD